MLAPLLLYIRYITNKVTRRTCYGCKGVDRAGEIDATGIVFTIIGR